MSPFQRFTEVHGPVVGRRDAMRDAIARYRGRLPEPLIEHWQDAGWCGYGEGLIWIIDPAQLDDVLEDWLTPSDQPATPFARSAFGDVFYWAGDEAHFLNVHRGTTKPLTDDLEVLFDYTLCDDEVLDHLLRRSLFREARERVGAPGHDECFAFVPALALGGPGTVETIQCVQLREHLGILAQIVGS